MDNEIPKQYNPREAEDKWRKFWEGQGLFRAKLDPAKKPFSIVIPPPNVTGILHMGHALNNTLQDILIRYHRMKGEASLWMPGTDHAGIATQNVVEKAIAKEGLKRQDLGREKFTERVWQWKEQYGSVIIRQLKKLGASCDWERLRFTMDDGYSAAVNEAFARLYEKGLIYRGSYIINWCPRCQTALSDEEAPHKELQGSLYYIRYPLVVSRKPLVVSKTSSKGGRTNDQRPSTIDHIVVATTRPETMLGDTAVAVNPKDKRYKDLIGRSVILPLVSREIKIIADAAVDMKFGSGAVKVTPAHDPNDYALGKKHKLEFINVMHADGRMNEFAGDYQGMDRFEAREAILEDLKEKGLLEKVEPHQLSAGHCYRCHTIIEPYLSKQWFVKMRPLAMPAIEAVKKGKIKFHPKRWTKVYLNWMENIQDWCISRQIWWGHRLPVYYCKNCLKQAGESMVNGQRSKVKAKTIGHRPSTIGQKGVIVSRVQPDKCPECGSADIYQDEDVLDTWFSSWLWPFATFGWPFDSPAENRGGLAQGKPLAPGSRIPNPDLGYFYPTSVLVTAPEIIFFWVARMVMAGYGFMGKEPFRDVYIHGTVRDAEGKKMSKSLGNIIDPLEIIAEYGADALRFSLISITAQGQDVYLSRERFEQGRNFCNKLWNASRFILMNLKGEEAKADLCVFFKDNALSLPNRWVLSRFYSTLKAVNKDLENFKFNEAANCLYSFFWHEFCDWYLEAIKPDIARKENQLVMYKVLEKSLRVLHPFMPFITEEIWQRLRDFSPSTIHHPPSKSIMTEPWPHLQEQLIDKQAEREAAAVFEVITSIRNMRAELGLPAQEALEAKAYAPGQRQRELLRQAQALIVSLSGLKGFSVEERYAKKPGEFVAVLRQMHIVIPLSAADTEKQKLRLRQRIAEASANIGRKEKMLANPAFIQKAPPEVVEAERRKLKELKEMLTKLKGTYDACE